MVKLPSKQDVKRQPGIQPGPGASVNVRGPQVNPNQARLPQFNVDLMGQEVIPNLAKTQETFAGERSRIANLESQAVTNNANGLLDFGKEMLRIRADIEDEQNKQEELAYLRALTGYDVGMSETVTGLRDSKAESAKWTPVVVDSDKRLTEEALATPGLSDQTREKLAIMLAQKRANYNESTSNESRRLQEEEEKGAIETELLTYQEIALKATTPKAKQDAFAEMDMRLLAAKERKIITESEYNTLKIRYLSGAATDLARVQAAENPSAFIHEASGQKPALDALLSLESKGEDDYTSQNTLGFSGRLQFGAPRLNDLGIYKPGAGETLDKWHKQGASKKWTGTWEFPMPDGSTKVLQGREGLEYFLANENEIQETIEELHFAKMDKEIEERGLGAYIGSVKGGVKVTRAGLYTAMHLGGAAGTQAFLEGRGNAVDDYGSSVRKYMFVGSQYDFYDYADPKELALIKERVKATFDTKLTAAINSVAKGTPTPVTELDELAATASATRDTALIDKVNSLKTINTVVENERKATPAELRAIISQARADEKTSGTAISQDLLQARVGLLNTMTKRIEENVLDWAEEVGEVELSPLDFQNPDSVKKRIYNAGIAASKYGANLTLLTEQDQENLAKEFENADAAKRLGMARLFVDSFGEFAPQAASQMSDKNPVIAQVVDLISLGQLDPRDGEMIFQNMPTLSGQEQGEYKVTVNDNFRQVTTDHFVGAFDPNLGNVNQSKIIATANALYAGLARKHGIPEGEVDTSLYTQALQKAAGQNAKGQGGFGWRHSRRVMLPPQMTDGDLDDAIESFDEDDLVMFSETGSKPVGVDNNGNITKVGADDVKDAYLVSVGPGVYKLSVTDPIYSGEPKFYMDASDPTKPYYLRADKIPVTKKTGIRTRTSIMNVLQ